MDYDCGSRANDGAQDFISDNILLIIVALAILFGLGYFVGKAAVKNGILEALREPDCPLASSGPCGL